MSFKPLNKFEPPPPLEQKRWHIDTPAEEYDHNFQLFVPSELETNGVRLIPFIPSLHSHLVYEHLHTPRGITIYDYLPYGPFASGEAAFLTWVELLRRETETVLFLILDKSFKEEAGVLPVAGLIAFRTTEAVNLSTEIGHVAIFPQFQRSHITTHSIHALFKWAFTPTKEPRGDAHGLGLRRVLWVANTLNGPSVRAAERMGFLNEGTLRWHRVLGMHKGEDPENGRVLDEEDANPEPSERINERPGGPKPTRHTVMLGIGWDRWRNVVREQHVTLVGRPVAPRSVTYAEFMRTA